MNYILAVFGSRNETLSFARLLKNNGISAGVINTPSQVGERSCSVSVKLPYNALALAERLISQAYFQSFKGFFIVYFSNGSMNIDKV